MVYGAINANGQRWYTQMSQILDAIHNQQLEYNWLLTDLDGVPQTIEACRTEQGYCWLTGEELTRMVRADDGQWIWAVLSGFDPSISLSEILQYPLPYAQEYEDFWKTPLSIQHPLAAIEIIPWDSSLTLFFSKRADLVEDFRQFFPLSEDLLMYCSRQHAP